MQDIKERDTLSVHHVLLLFTQQGRYAVQASSGDAAGASSEDAAGASSEATV